MCKFADFFNRTKNGMTNIFVWFVQKNGMPIHAQENVRIVRKSNAAIKTNSMKASTLAQNVINVT